MFLNLIHRLILCYDKTLNYLAVVKNEILHLKVNHSSFFKILKQFWVGSE